MTRHLLIALWLLVALARNAYPSPLMEAVRMVYRVTAYCPCKICCGPNAKGITASGKPARGKLIAADKSIPFGTMLDVPGYGVAPVLDRGGAIKGNRLDVFFPTHKQAIAWGIKYLVVDMEWIND